MEGLDPFKGKDVRRAAEILQEKLGVETREPKTTPKVREVSAPKAQLTNASSLESKGLPVMVNPLLDFELKDLDVQHPYLVRRGFTPETIQRFGLGFCNRGMLRNRIVIPIHNPQGKLVGYAGRVVDDRAISEENPKYKLPASRERDGQLLEFRKSELLYNAHRISGKTIDLIVVEGFPSVWWLDQLGFKNVVALMGCDCSPEQGKLILGLVESDGRIWIMSDGDPAGERCAQSMFTAVGRHRFVRRVNLGEGEQPTDCISDELDALLNM
jgi:DNA primase